MTKTRKTENPNVPLLKLHVIFRIFIIYSQLEQTSLDHENKSAGEIVPIECNGIIDFRNKKILH